jgi:hypothetical protein
MISETGESPFMALPPELRCHIYNCLGPELVYKHAFPTLEICCWPVYRMSTALLQLNKTVYEEINDSLVQKPLQNMNDYHPPTIILGPTFTRANSLATLSDCFHEAALTYTTTVDQIQQPGCDIGIVVCALASWYNEGVSPQHALSENIDDFTNEAQRSATNILQTFVEQSLKRMSNTNTSEIRFRLLVGCSENEGARATDEQVLEHILRHKRKVAQDPRRRAIDIQSDHSLTIVYLDSGCSFSFLLPPDLRSRGMQIEFGSVCNQDQHLFDKLLLSPPAEYFWS